MKISSECGGKMICSRCVMDSTIPDIRFDEKGICNYCQVALERLSRELYNGPQHTGKVSELVEKIRTAGSNRKYDCLIGVSGGLDSTYTAWLVKKKFGLRPLAVHFDNGWNSELSVRNIERITKSLNIDLLTNVVNWREFRDIQVSFLKSSIPNAEIPTDHAILATLYREAAKNRIKYIIQGGNLATEVIMPDAWMHDAKDLRLLKAVHSQYGSIPIKTFPTLSYRSLFWYILFKRIKFIGILNYVDYRKEEASKLLEDEIGWRPYPEKHYESIFTRFFQSYMLPAKYGMDKRRPHYSSMIISEQMSREQALRLLEKDPFDEKIIQADINYVSKKLGLSIEQFSSLMNLPPRSSHDFPNSSKLIRLFQPIVRRIKDLATGRSS